MHLSINEKAAVEDGHARCHATVVMLHGLGAQKRPHCLVQDNGVAVTVWLLKRCATRSTIQWTQKHHNINTHRCIISNARDHDAVDAEFAHHAGKVGCAVAYQVVAALRDVDALHQNIG